MRLVSMDGLPEFKNEQDKIQWQITFGFSFAPTFRVGA